EGSVAKQILKQVRESDIDFIIIGTNGESGFQKFLLGSHTWEVIKKSGIPVFALPKDVLYTGVKNIVFATEYRDGELPGIKFLIQLAEQFNAELTILHITNYILSEELEKDVFENFKNELKNKAPYKKLNLRAVHSDDIITGLNEFCSRTKADWLVMSPGKSFFLEKIFNSAKSITKKMSIDSHIPLLMVPDFYYPEKINFFNDDSKTLKPKI
ncbi:MAG: universal stress protein, partial [Bacteroidetes bacterium]|nr:universal stress protein [Bacteroidota bacterium]